MNQTLEKPDTNPYTLNMKRIVVAVDLSTHSKKTATYAAQFAKSFGASLTLVHAFAPERITEFTTEEVHERYEVDMRNTERDLDKLAAGVRETYPDCDTEFRVGDRRRGSCTVPNVRCWFITRGQRKVCGGNGKCNH